MNESAPSWRDWLRAPARQWRGWPVLVLVSVLTGALAVFGGTASLITGPVDEYPRGGRAAAFGLLVYAVVVLLGGLALWLRPTRALPGQPLVREALVLAMLLLPSGWIDRWMFSPRPRWPIPFWELLLLGWLIRSRWTPKPQATTSTSATGEHPSQEPTPT